MKGQIVNTLGLGAIWSLLKLLSAAFAVQKQLRRCINDESDCVPIKLYLHKQAAAGFGPLAVVGPDLENCLGHSTCYRSVSYGCTCVSSRVCMSVSASCTHMSACEACVWMSGNVCGICLVLL